MASLDFMSDTAKGYRFVWVNRKYLAYHATTVIFVKVACLLSIIVLMVNDNLLRQGLLLLPAHALEGYFLINLVRLVLYHEPIFLWGREKPLPKTIIESRLHIKQPLSRKICLQYALVVYLLIKIINSLVVGLIIGTDENTITDGLGPPTPAAALVSLVALAFIFWAFRLLWIYVPVAAGFSMPVFLNRISGIGNSLYFLGVFIISFIPLILFYGFASQLLEMFITNIAVMIIIENTLQSLITLIISSIQAIAISYGIYDLMTTPKTVTPDKS